MRDLLKRKNQHALTEVVAEYSSAGGKGGGEVSEGIKKADMQQLATYQAELRKKPALRFLFFELTDKCNLNCRHCGSNCSGKNSSFLDVDLIERILQGVSSAYDPKDIMICLTGGEPLLHPGLCDVIKSSHDLGFPIGITTNGTLIDNLSARQMARSGLDTVAVSIDGIGKTHDSFRAMRGSFDRALFGIQALQRVGIEPQVITVVHKQDINELEDMFTLLRKMGIYSWRLVNVEPIGRAAHNEELLLDAEGIRRLFDFIRDKRFDQGNEMEVTFGCSHFVTYDYEKTIRDFYFQCGAGLFVASITANGDIIGCLDIERRKDLVQGNAYKDDFVSVWESGYKVFREDRTERSKSCYGCAHKSVCLGDSFHTWNFDLNEPNYCIARMLEETK